jgi:hypothetical protein
MKKANEKTVPKNSLSLSASAIDKHQCNEILHKDTHCGAAISVLHIIVTLIYTSSVT